MDGPGTTQRELNPRWCLAYDTIDRNDIDRLIQWLRTYPRLTKGAVTRDFESRWSNWMARSHSIFCNSGSSANLLMYYALLVSGRLRNKKVIVPSVGWITSIAPAIQFGFEPIMCEADPETFGLDLNHLEDLLKQYQAQTVMLVQVLGVPHKMRELLALKERYEFVLMEDACAAIGASYEGKKVGSFGDMASFSFYFGHQMSTVEGGMVSTDDKALADLLLMLRSHGWSKDLDQTTHRSLVEQHSIDDFHSPFVFYEPGFNLRSTDINAFLGIGQLEKLDWMTEQRRRNHARYLECLGSHFYVQRPPAGSQVASISVGLIAESQEQRRRIVNNLSEHGIETRIFSAGNLGLHPFWASRYGSTSFPVADRIHHCGFFLPNHAGLNDDDITTIARVVMEVA
ncbi:MAG: DegT/DnrJ/EryC1/StrS family aminotransferase [Nitrospira sp.]|nr:DegT/DnrJ/EryC1/StrS family aminotransferase [Nitrospira sp.]MDH4244775.1 DegT/DnrJ/EryC1/StrS family aminotransferase [Nitrospira sp.]MDH4355118.1 DegT/DnrJ/EryC1/StrS family aminotransferase [Nitrospira sp.]MDH5320003.1 DegT/DnrJ/EryC1/StrS family aminotransferase [Nitrospira sp.]